MHPSAIDSPGSLASAGAAGASQSFRPEERGAIDRALTIERFIRLDALGSLLTYLEASHGWGGGPLLDQELREEVFTETVPPVVRSLSAGLVDELWPEKSDHVSAEFVLATTRSALLTAAMLQQLAIYPDRCAELAHAMIRRAQHDLATLRSVPE